MSDLAGLTGGATPAGRYGSLACLGDQETEIEADVTLVCDPESATPATTPAWLSVEGGRSLVLTDGGATIPARPDPSLTVPFGCGEEGGRYLVRAHFDDPAAATCEVRRDRRREAPALDERIARHLCRQQFVVTELVPAAR